MSGTAGEQDANSQLQRRVKTALTSSDYLPLHDIKVEACDGVVTLSGKVSRYYLKQVAQTTVLGVSGVNRLHNGLVVRS